MKPTAWQNEMQEVIKLKEHFAITNQSLLKEIDSLLTAQDEVVTLLYSRRVLEVIITEICTERLNRERGTEPLNSLIDKLFKEKILPEYIQTSMQNLNRISTFGAHPKEFDPRQVRTILIELLTILDWYFKEKNYQQVVGKKEEKIESVVQEKITKPLKQISKPKTRGEGGKIKLNSVAVAAAVVVVVAVIYFLQTSVNKPLSNKPITENVEVKQRKNETKPPLADTAAKNKITTPVVSLNTATQAEHPSISPKSVAKKALANKQVSGISQKPAYTISEVKDDINILFQQLTDKNLSFTQRKNISIRIRAICEKNAEVKVFKENVMVDKYRIEDYLDHVLSLTGMQVYIQKPQKSGTDKISVLEVTEKK
jgi:hypothetical protein